MRQVFNQMRLGRGFFPKYKSGFTVSLHIFRKDFYLDLSVGRVSESKAQLGKASIEPLEY